MYIIRYKADNNNERPVLFIMYDKYYLQPRHYLKFKMQKSYLPLHIMIMAESISIMDKSNYLAVRKIPTP